MNRVILMGNLGADAELKTLQNGSAVLNLRIATSEKWMKDGEKKERTDWHMCEMWGKRAESVAQYLTKGSKIMVEGKIRNSTYDDKDGKKCYKTTILIEELEFCGGGSGERRAPREDPSDPPRPKEKGVTTRYVDGKAVDEFPDDPDDLPF